MYGSDMKIEMFEMERYQSLYWHQVAYDLSESGVTPLTIGELLGPEADAEAFLGMALGYPLSEGSPETREAIAAWYPGAVAENVTVMNGGSEANFLTLWTLLGSNDRIAYMVPNYLQGQGLGKALGRKVDAFPLRFDAGRWSLDLPDLDRAVGARTKVIMVCNPNNPTGYVMSAEEMQAIVAAAERVGAWIVADEIYRGAELDTDRSSPTFWGLYDKVVVTSGLSKAFGMPGLRIGWAIAPAEMIGRIWRRHDYTTLTPSMISDRLAAAAMMPDVREKILARTRSIIRANYPAIETWLSSHADLFSWARPGAGAICFANLIPNRPTVDLVERIRTEASVLLVPGEMFGIGPGIRFGFGYDIEHTLKGLSAVDEVLSKL
jgi:aspartate/methionine/tyrosine aminotransferase